MTKKYKIILIIAIFLNIVLVVFTIKNITNTQTISNEIETINGSIVSGSESVKLLEENLLTSNLDLVELSKDISSQESQIVEAEENLLICQSEIEMQNTSMVEIEENKSAKQTELDTVQAEIDAANKKAAEEKAAKEAQEKAQQEAAKSSETQVATADTSTPSTTTTSSSSSSGKSVTVVTANGFTITYTPSSNHDSQLTDQYREEIYNCSYAAYWPGGESKYMHSASSGFHYTYSDEIDAIANQAYNDVYEDLPRGESFTHQFPRKLATCTKTGIRNNNLAGEYIIIDEDDGTWSIGTLCDDGRIQYSGMVWL